MGHPAVLNNRVKVLTSLHRKLIEHVSPIWTIPYYPKGPLTDKMITKMTKELSIHSDMKIKNKPFEDLKEFEDYVDQVNVFAGVEFDTEYKTLKSFPKVFRFYLKFPSEMRTEEYDPKDINWKTGELFPTIVRTTPRGYNSSFGGPEASYISEGFATLQYFLSTAFIKEAIKERKIHSHTNYQEMALSLTRFPEPPFNIDNFIDKTSMQMLPLIPLAYISIFVRSAFLMMLCDRTITAVYSGMAYYLASNMALVVLNLYYVQIPFGYLLALSMIGNIGVGFAFRIALYQDVKKEVINWTNVLNPPYQDQQYSIGFSMIMMFAGTLILAFVFFCIEYIWKGNLCERIPIAREYFRRSSRVTALDNDGMKRKVYLAIKGVKKVHKKEVLLDNVSFNVYVNEVTALLGNHESGKKTLLDIIIGFTYSTEGGVLFNYKDPLSDPFARRVLGYCPQKNIIFGNLSVAQHIIFFGTMRGLSKKNVKIEVKRYTRILKIDGETKAKNLSISQRRKLSIVNAFCGRTSVVVIDEPSINTDPMTKREIWDIIHKEKEGRAVLISTNYMDEADMPETALLLCLKVNLFATEPHFS
uniref:ABC transporter domain-containing protein n=1 Tax=Megaselia scalaris TaxID=36166 RepID=T1GC86_MEGSC